MEVPQLSNAQSFCWTAGRRNPALLVANLLRESPLDNHGFPIEGRPELLYPRGTRDVANDCRLP